MGASHTRDQRQRMMCKVYHFYPLDQLQASVQRMQKINTTEEDVNVLLNSIPVCINAHLSKDGKHLSLAKKQHTIEATVRDLLGASVDSTAIRSKIQVGLSKYQCDHIDRVEYPDFLVGLGTHSASNDAAG